MSASTLTDVPSPNRLSGVGLIDRDHALRFTFDGQDYSGYRGDTLASALLASGITLVGRSFKYHRPRGILTAGSEEPNALVELRTGARREPNTRATVAELFDGLEARSQNRWPSLRFDIGSVNSLLSPLFVAGFYYKTFMWPAAWWEKLYEPIIRRAAGLGRASTHADPDNYEKASAFCDVLIVGAGPAGLAAALSAGRSGARVILCDEDFMLGGRLNGDRREIDGMSGALWAAKTVRELASLPDVRVMRRTTVFGAYDGKTFGALERVSDHLAVPAKHQPRQRLWRILAKHTILAAGAIERPLVFGGNDRPGVMMSSAVRTYVNRFRVIPGRRVALFTTTDDGWKTAFDLVQAGIPPVAIIDARLQVSPDLVNEAKRTNIRLMLGARVTGTSGALSLDKIHIREYSGTATVIHTDVLAMSGGWNPTIALTTHRGARPRWSDAIGAFVPGITQSGFDVVGAAAGEFRLLEALHTGFAAGTAAAAAAGFNASSTYTPRVDPEACAQTSLWRVTPARGKAFVDFQHDVTDIDVELAAREGFRSAELLKRYTTLGMATDQGKTSGVNGQAIMAAFTATSISDVGTTVYRPPYTPIAIGAFTGHHRGKNFKATRLTSTHAWAQRHGATFVDAGQWLRARWFALPGESEWLTTVTREVNTVRTRVGVSDVSTLGKIDVQGPDAAVFLDFVYANSFSNLSMGRVRYGLILREDGIVMDDGTIARLGPMHYVVSTTTVNAAKVMQHLEFVRQILKPDLDVQLASVTEQWAQLAIAGPNSRQVLERLLNHASDLSNSAFPYMACKEFVWNEIPARLFRISFSGELAYELAVPANYGDALIHAVLRAGAEFGIAAYGTEALGVLRMEKGHVAGNEINGTTTAGDLGLGKLLSTKKDFIGRVLAGREGLADPHRPTLVGILPTIVGARLHAGGHLLTLDCAATLENDQGFISSVAYSPSVGQWIGLAFLSDGLSRLGEVVRVYDALRGIDMTVTVTSPTFYDPDGLKLRG